VDGITPPARSWSAASTCGFDLRNTAARLGNSGGGATTLRHYADPVPEADRHAAQHWPGVSGRAHHS